jgi:tRNA A-37 threonylcarbamoyl transferase component Bud32
MSVGSGPGRAGHGGRAEDGMDEVVPRPRSVTAPEAPLALAPEVPDRFGGRYRLLGLLGRGGMADVYRADDEVLGRQVAVKVFRAGAGAEAQRRRFEFEVRLAASLDHRQLVRVYDAGIDGEHRWCVMQLVPGGTLADTLMPLPAHVLAARGADVAEALAHLHDRGIVHRDVKPSNVLVGERGEAYLSDFGICGVAGDPDARFGGPALGTPAYLSPEQVRGEPAGPAGDVYALGLVLLECVTGHREYPGDPLAAALARLTREPQVPVDTDPRLAALLAAMTAADPHRRPTAAEVAVRLRDLGGAGVPLAPVSDAGAGRRGPALVAVGAGTALALGAGMLVAFELTRTAVADPVGPGLGVVSDARDDAAAVLGVRSSDEAADSGAADPGAGGGGPGAAGAADPAAPPAVTVPTGAPGAPAAPAPTAPGAAQPAEPDDLVAPASTPPKGTAPADPQADGAGAPDGDDGADQGDGSSGDGPPGDGDGTDSETDGTDDDGRGNGAGKGNGNGGQGAGRGRGAGG